MPQTGTYMLNEEIPLVQHVGLNGEFTLIETDNTERKVSIVNEGRAIVLIQSPTKTWWVPQGKFYSSKSGRKLTAMEMSE